MRYTKIPADTFKDMQLNAGVLVKSFDVANASVAAADIIGATSGGVNFTATPSFTDFGEDIDNCPKNMKELKRLESWEVKMSGTFVTTTASLAKSLTGPADLDEKTGKITPRNEVADADFEEIWWVGDYSAENSEESGGFVAVHMMNALSTGGFQIQSTEKAKGQFSFEYTAHYSIDAQDTVPFEVYVVDGTAANAQAETKGTKAAA